MWRDRYVNTFAQIEAQCSLGQTKGSCNRSLVKLARDYQDAREIPFSLFGYDQPSIVVTTSSS